MTPGPQIEPVTPGVVHARVAELALEVLASGARIARVAVDGAVDADSRAMADGVAAHLIDLGRPVLRVHANDFLRPRSVRLEHGEDDPDSGYERWVDHLALQREVLDPLGPDGDGWWLPDLWNPSTDRATRSPRRAAPPGSVVVVDGPFLLRWEIADAFDVTAHLQTSAAAVERRVPEADRARVTGAWQRYLDETWPHDRADLVVRADHPERPALVLT